MARKKKVELEEDGGINDTIASIEQRFGKGAIMMLDNDDYVQHIEAISTGSLSLDIALGIGGYARGRVLELYGNEAAGKTTLALHMIAEAQKAGGSVAFIDAEHALDVEYAKRLGIDPSKILISQPDSGEQALEITETLARSGQVDVIVIDSVAALTPRAEIEGEMGDSHMGLQARLMSQALRKLTSAISATNTTLIFINQLRQKIGIVFGNPNVTTGGNALKFYSSIRLEISKSTPIKNGDNVIGNLTKVKVVKNKVAPPFKQVTFDIIYGEGISQTGEIVDLGVQAGILEKGGAWYAYKGETIGQGREKTKAYLEENPKVAEEIKGRVYAYFGIGDADAMDEPTVEDVVEETVEDTDE